MAGARGEAHLTVDGEQRAVLFTNRALADAERQTGKTILQLMRGVQSNDLGMSDIVQLLQVGMEHARRADHSSTRAYTLNDAWLVLDTCGFGTVAAAVFEAIGAVMAYDGQKGDADANPPANGTGANS